LLVTAMLLVMGIVYQFKKVDVNTVLVQPPSQPHIIAPPEPIPPELPPEPKKVEPTWTNWPKVRSVDTSLGKVLGDIESHMPAGHIYKDSDKITWGHETTHGINSNIRNNAQRLQAKIIYETRYSIFGYIFKRRIRKVEYLVRVNGFYCLEDRAAVIVEPPTTIREVAAKVPQSLRGGVYNLYMVSQAGSWNDTPLYIFDEWVAYTNGSEVRKDLNISTRAETVAYMMEFNVYAMTLAKVVKEKGNYDDTQFKAFIMWNIERSVGIYNNEGEAATYLNKLRSSGDAESLRQFAREYFGADWCKKTLGF